MLVSRLFNRRLFLALPLVLPLVFLSGNCNLVYAIIRKRSVFHQLANLPTDTATIHKALQKKKKAPDGISRTSSQETVSMEGSTPAVPAEPGTLKASLVAIPGAVPTEAQHITFTHNHDPSLPGFSTHHLDQTAFTFFSFIYLTVYLCAVI